MEDVKNVPVLSGVAEKQFHVNEVIQFKAKIFDVLNEIGSYQVAINKLVEKKDNLLLELNRIQSK